MGAQTPWTDEYQTLVISTIQDRPYYVLLGLLIIVCIFTRITTGQQARYSSAGNGASSTKPSLPVPMLPYWVPFLGHSFSFATRFLDFLQAAADGVPSGLFALKIMGGTHNMVVSPGLVKELLTRPNIPVEFEALTYRFLTLVFADKGIFKKVSEKDPQSLRDMHRVLASMMRDPFLGESVDRVVQAVETQTTNLLSGTSSWVDHTFWERAARVEIVSTGPSQAFVAEADFFELTKNFVGNIATTVLMGSAFVENNPTILPDLWLLDSQINTLMLGLPSILTPGTGAATRARARIIDAVAEHHAAMLATLKGDDPGFRYSDLSDVSPMIWDRVRTFQTHSLSPYACGVGDATILWAMNTNANKVIGWMLFYLYSDPHLLAAVRAELAPHVHHSSSSGPIPEPARLALSRDALFQRCPLLKGALFETMRLEGGSLFYRAVTADFALTESAADAARLGKSEPDTYHFRKGEFVCVPFPVQQASARYFKNPEKFDARRFWVRKADDEVSVEYGDLRPWGGRQNICKGRNFAEREVLAFVAGIVMAWDVEPAGGRAWKHPGNLMTAGTFDPKRDVRVRMWRRKW